MRTNKLLFTLSLALAASPLGLLAQPGNVTEKGKALPYSNAPAEISSESMKPTAALPKVWKAPSLAPNLLYDQADGLAKVWGFLQFDYRYRTNAVVNFTTDSPATYSMVYDYRQELGVSKVVTAATFVGNTLYGYACTYYGPGALVPYAVGTINPETGIFSPIRTVSIGTGLLINDMTYDPVTKKMYGIQFNENSETGENFSNLYRIDPGTGQIDSIGKVDYLLYALSADVDGTLYGIARDMAKDMADDNNSFLVRIPAQTIAAGKTTAERVAPNTVLGVNVYYQQSMEFDRTTHKLWWLTQSHEGYPYMAEIDCKTGKIKAKRQLNVQAQITSLAIPYQIVNAQAPSYPQRLTATPAAMGGNQVRLTWANPSTDYMGNALTDLSGVRLYRDNELIKTFDGVEKGASASYSDNDITQPGYYTYRVQGYNTSGDGIYKEARLFVGKDKPGKVRNIVLTTNGSTAKLSWNSPATGLNNGWYDKASLRYKVVRQPDRKIIAESISDSTLNDEVTKYAGYSYQIIPTNAQGQGDTITSQVAQFGPTIEVPYTDSLNTAAGFNEWIALDANGDGTTWNYDSGNKVTNYTYSLSAANDYLVSPPIAFEDGKSYQVRYTYYTSNWVTADDHTPIMERMKVYCGKQPTVSGLNSMIEDLGEFHTASGDYLYGKTLFTPGAGKGYVAFQACSDADHGIIYLKDVSIREYSAKDVSLKSLHGSATGNVNTPYSFGVDICNEGSKAASGFTIEILDAKTGAVIAQKQITDNLNAEQTKNYSVEWTPTATGKYSFTARVKLDGDTYPIDNIGTQVVYVTVSDEAAQTWLTVNQDHSATGMGGWYIPFNFGSKYTKIDVIYLAKEMQLKNIRLTGLQFVYDTPQGTPASEANVKVSIGNTAQDYIICDPNDSYNVHFVDADCSEVYSGTFSLDSGAVKSCPLVINFTTPFDYSEGNIVVRYETNMESANLLSGDYQPWYHYCSNYDDGDPQRYRTAIYRGNTSTVNPSKVGWNYWTPYTMFAYTTSSGLQGVMQPVKNGLNLMQNGKALLANKTLEAIEVIATNGATMRKATHTQRLDVAGLHGAYLVRYTLGGTTATVKMIIK